MEDNIDRLLLKLEENLSNDNSGHSSMPLVTCDDAYISVNSTKILQGPPFPVLCKNDAKHGLWLMIQQRFNGKEIFGRTWDEYKKGFPKVDADMEFFLGLQKIHQITNSRRHELLLLLTLDGTEKYAKYDHFLIGNERQKFKLKELGLYSGDAGDSLRAHIGHAFSIYDATKGPKQHNYGGWWFHSDNKSNLNGEYIFGASPLPGILWDTMTSNTKSLKKVEMLIRPVHTEKRRT